MTRGVDLRGAAVVVTGASSGIGREASRLFAREGADVALAARGEQALFQAAAECRAIGVRAVAVPTDVADPEAVDRLARRAVQEYGRIDVWVNNAAVMAFGALGDVPVEVWQRVVAVDLLGTVHGARAAVPVMRRQGRGVIVNVASLYGRMTSPYVGAYATSKFGVRGFSQVLRQELEKDRGVHVGVVLPGSTDTPIWRHAANYTGHRVRPVPPVASTRRAARAVVRQATHPRRQRVVGTTQQLVSWGHAVLPGVYADLAPHIMRTAAVRRRKEDPHDGNVFAPRPADDSVRGGWRRLPKRAAAGAGLVAVAAAALAAGRRDHR